jgi:hypothetical protein
MNFRLLVLAFVLPLPSFTQPMATSDPYPLHRAQQVLTNIIIHDIFSPPVASRIYFYAHASAYEIFIQEHDTYKSLRGQIAHFPAIPLPTEKISYPLAGVYAMLETGKNLTFSEQMMADSIETILHLYRKKISTSLWNASIAYGKKISDVILQWARQDRYVETRKQKRYSFLKDEGKWLPTPPMYMAAVEPHWRDIRTLLLDSASQFKPEEPPPFSSKKESVFYEMAHHVYATSKQLTAEQKEIANFWDCNPFAVSVHGHINYATKKLSPGGHWLSIVEIASKQVHADLVKTSAAYTLTSIALFDGFISCWDEKYRSQLIRPESYIHAYIDEAWTPLLQTPPFPEYTSGHSVISTAAATVLSDFFGDEFLFNDTSEEAYGLKMRTFSSFQEACNEAAISRLYGGIHYLPAIELGQAQGKKVGQHVLKKLTLRKPAVN